MLTLHPDFARGAKDMYCLEWDTLLCPVTADVNNDITPPLLRVVVSQWASKSYSNRSRRMYVIIVNQPVSARSVVSFGKQINFMHVGFIASCEKSGRNVKAPFHRYNTYKLYKLEYRDSPIL